MGIYVLLSSQDGLPLHLFQQALQNLVPTSVTRLLFSDIIRISRGFPLQFLAELSSFFFKPNTCILWLPCKSIIFISLTFFFAGHCRYDAFFSRAMFTQPTNLKSIQGLYEL